MGAPAREASEWFRVHEPDGEDGLYIHEYTNSESVVRCESSAEVES
jgi:hypothetical protein